MSNIYYSIVAFLAIFVFLIINFNYLLLKDDRPEVKGYQRYLVSILFFFITDAFWGVLAECGNVRLIYTDTVLYYVTMAFSVFFSCRYIISYLRLKFLSAKVISYVALGLTSTVMVFLVINHFTPIFFDFDAEGHYRAYIYRDVALCIQFLLFLFISIMSLVVAMREKSHTRKRRNTAIFLFSLTITIALATQYLFPLMPLYSIGLMLGMLIIHVFIHNEEEHVQMKEISHLNKELIEEQDILQRKNNEIARAYAIVKVLSRDYHTIWLADKKTRKIEMVRESGVKAINEAIQLAMQFDDCNDAMMAYIEHFVCDEDKERMRRRTNFDNILQQLDKTDYFAVNYRRRNLKGELEYNQMTFANVNTGEEKSEFVFGFRDVNDIVQQEMALRKEIDDARVAAEANISANKAKTKFLQNMSHEIRTPLNAMFGFSQLLGMPDGSWSEEEKQQYNSYIYNSYRMLEMLISDIIDIADSEHDNYRIEISDVNLNEVCRSATMSVEFRVPAGVSLSFDSDFPDDYVIKSDGRRIQQVLINYLTNACKNTQKGEIRLTCSRTEHPGKITFAVTDTGKGVPPEKASLIFNRFIKLDQFVQGSGLGLNICMTIADKLGGRVYLDTTYTGGARFVFVIDDSRQ